MSGPAQRPLPLWWNPSRHPGVRLGWDVLALVGEHDLRTNPLAARAAMPEHVREQFDQMLAGLERGAREGGQP